MRGLTDFVSTIIGALNEADLPYFVTGSYASIAYSEPRSTLDIDLVVRASFELLEDFHTKMLALGLYAPSIKQDIDIFNVIDPESQWKADIIAWRDEPFDRERLERRVLVEILPGLHAYIPTVEDMILAKLDWIKGRDSPMQLWDIESMLEINADSIDYTYLRHWARKLDVSTSLERLLSQ